jgi:hypothetical protein
MKKNFVALSRYCKDNDLSLPSNFKVDKLVEDAPKDAVKATGYKFSEEYLDEIVPKLGFRRTKSKSKHTPRRLALYKLDKDYIAAIETDSEDTLRVYHAHFGYEYAKSMKIIAETEFTLEHEDIIKHEEIIKGLKLLSKSILGFDVFKALFDKSSNTIVHLTEKDDKKEQCDKLKELAISIVKNEM